jgi:hypothetical protein
MDISMEDFNRFELNRLNKVLLFIFNNEERAHKSFFKSDGTLANGTICLVDEIDSEIREEQPLNFNSGIVLISTLHGG